MKALRYHAQKDLRYEDVPEPSPGPGQVKIKVSYAGICGSDLREYTSGPYIITSTVTYGHEFSGTVVELGEGVSGWKAGERVTGLGAWACGKCYYCKRAQYDRCTDRTGRVGGTVDGCMAEYLVAPVDSLQKLPDSVSDELGALVEPLAVGLHAVYRARITLGDTIAIVGDGPIGLATLLSARAAGVAAVYMVSKYRSRGEVAAAMGATQVIYLDEDPVQKIKELTGGLGVDITFDCAGRDDSPELCVKLTRAGGSIVLVAVVGHKPLPIQLRPLFGFEKSIIPANSNNIHEFAAMVALLADKRIDPSRLITAKVPLKDAVEKGFHALLDNKENNLKILLVP